MTMQDPTERFTNRAQNYHIHRPHYPRAVTDLMANRLGLTAQSVVADVGAGTGISSELFLSYGCKVYAVEPNADMRAVAAQHYGDVPGFHLVDGTAENTTLPDGAVDFVVAGQAFHWFNARLARQEFARILHPRGWVVLFWNNRDTGVSPFLDDFNRVMDEFDIHKVAHRTQEVFAVGGDVDSFFGRGGAQQVTFDNPVSYGWESLLGRALSASYAPLPDHPSYPSFVAALRAVFDAHQQDGLVWMNYTTQVYYGQP